MSRWNDRYLSGDTPWDRGAPEPLLVEAVEAGLLPAGRALEIGCGTGTNARFLAARGWEVVAVDLSPTAIERARGRGGEVRYEVLDVLAEAPPGGPFDLVFDRGCLHTFDLPGDRARFAARVAAALRPGGRWLSIAGSTEGPPREGGPPRRTARDLLEAIEPVLELIELRAAAFTLADDRPAAWFCLSALRATPAVPSTRRG
jgi:SAM-dependent methyltransferase